MLQSGFAPGLLCILVAVAPFQLWFLLENIKMSDKQKLIQRNSQNGSYAYVPNVHRAMSTESRILDAIHTLTYHRALTNRVTPLCSIL
jgi:hypothetical protein